MCCSGWNILFDEASCDRFKTMPVGPVRDLLDEHVERLSGRPDGSRPIAHARMRLTAGQPCPLLSAEKLCRIHAEHGEQFLPATCATYPRVKHSIDGLPEQALSMSCPEAARLVLLSPNLLREQSSPQYEFRWKADAAEAPLTAYFWPMREFVLRLLTNRRYALWQRLFLVGLFVQRLDAISSEGKVHGFGPFLRDFAAATQSEALRTSMDGIPPDLRLQLDMVLRLAGLKLPRSQVSERFRGVIEAFTRGIRTGSEDTMQSLVARYARAHDERFEPFFLGYPHILENLLVNAVFRSFFPLGLVAGQPNLKPNMNREFALLATHFALTKGLLIGVAGYYGGSFSAEHVIRTVQAASRHFEHHPAFLDEAYALLSAAGLDNLRGLTALIRN